VEAKASEHRQRRGAAPAGEATVGWPRLSPEALHGLAGDVVRCLEPHTESDPVAVLVQLLTCFGSLVGRGPHFRVEADRHGVNLFCCLVGATAKGRKGTSIRHVLELLAEVDPTWNRDRVASGLSSGEGLIWAVRDPTARSEPRPGHRHLRNRPLVIHDHGVLDKRLCVLEGEFATTLRVLERRGNTLSPILRSAWEEGNLRSLTKSSPAAATGAHISLVAHITRRELLRHLDTLEAGNGFGNRFLWACVRRSKCLPEGGGLGAESREPLVERLREAARSARSADEISRDAGARRLWREVYPSLSEGRPGLLGAVTARAEAQTLRLACLYALLDGACEIRQEHLVAALALWDYTAQSARWIFGSASGDPVTDRILQALRSRNRGLTLSSIGALFGGHRRSGEIRRALEALQGQGLAESLQVPTGGRPSEIWRAV